MLKVVIPYKSYICLIISVLFLLSSLKVNFNSIKEAHTSHHAVRELSYLTLITQLKFAPKKCFFLC